MFQGIDEDKLFNLFSLYGNIVRIKLLRNKPDHALIQMGDGFQAELAVHFLKVRSDKLINCTCAVKMRMRKFFSRTLPSCRMEQITSSPRILIVVSLSTWLK